MSVGRSAKDAHGLGVGLSEQTNCRWRREYGGLQMDQVNPTEDARAALVGALLRACPLYL